METMAFEGDELKRTLQVGEAVQDHWASSETGTEFINDRLDSSPEVTNDQAFDSQSCTRSRAIMDSTNMKNNMLADVCCSEQLLLAAEKQSTEFHPTNVIFSTNLAVSSEPENESTQKFSDTIMEGAVFSSVPPAIRSSDDVGAGLPSSFQPEAISGSADTGLVSSPPSILKEAAQSKHDQLEASVAEIEVPNRSALAKKSNKKKDTQQEVTVSANRLKKTLGNAAFAWNGENLIETLTKAFEFNENAALQWYCHICVRANEEYEQTNVPFVQVGCDVCKRTWHSQCYDTEYKQDKDFWESDNVPCFGCRAGEWKCILCGVNGYENSHDADGIARAAETLIFRCTETNCLTRCHIKCVEAELIRPKACFVRTKANPVRGRPVKTEAGKTHEEIEERLVDADLLPVIPAANIADQSAPANLNEVAPESDQTIGSPRPPRDFAVVYVAEPLVETDAAVTSPHNGAVMPSSIVSSDWTMDINMMIAGNIIKVNEEANNTSPHPASNGSSPADLVGASDKARESSVDVNQPQSGVETNDDISVTASSQDATGSRRSSSIAPPASDVASTISCTTNSLAVAQATASNIELQPSNSQQNLIDVKAATKPARGKPKAGRKSTRPVAVLPSADPVVIADAASGSFSFRCGRHECNVCKRLGRSVTCPTADGAAAAAGGAASLCMENVAKSGQFRKIQLASCLRCCRATHFHPHCMPPTYNVNSYNPNFMLCEDHIVCEENPDVLEGAAMGLKPEELCVEVQENTNTAERAAKNEVDDRSKNLNRKISVKKRKPGKAIYKKRPKKVLKNEAKVRLTDCSACTLPEDKKSGNNLIDCRKCAAVVHRFCLPTGKDTPTDATWFCCIHDENEATSPVLLYDVVWCKDGRYPWWPARVIAWESVPKKLCEKFARTAAGNYVVLYFQAANSTAQEYAFLNSGRVLPFEETQTSEAFVKGYTSNKPLKGALENAIEYYHVLQRAREVLNAKTFQIFSASWEYQTIGWNQAMPGVHYARRGAARSRTETKKSKKANAEVDATDLQAAAKVVICAYDAAAPIASSSGAHRSGSPHQRKRRTAATKCTDKMIDYTEESDKPEEIRCQCRAQPAGSGGIACDPLTCLNAHGRTECNDKNCRLFPFIGKCGNRRLENMHAPPGCLKHYNSTLRVANCGRKGKGLITRVPFGKGDYIIEYVGEVITSIEQTRREKELFSKYDQPMFYFMSLDRTRVLDAQYKGNLSRFANHSCDPNAKIARVSWQGEYHIVLQALRDLASNEEVTYNYDWGTKGKNPMACNCGAKNCVGTIGKKEDRKKRKLDAVEDDAGHKPNKRGKVGKKGKAKAGGKRAAKRTVSSAADADPAKIAKKRRVSKKQQQSLAADTATTSVQAIESNISPLSDVAADDAAVLEAKADMERLASRQPAMLADAATEAEKTTFASPVAEAAGLSEAHVVAQFDKNVSKDLNLHAEDRESLETVDTACNANICAAITVENVDETTVSVAEPLGADCLQPKRIISSGVLTENEPVMSRPVRASAGRRASTTLSNENAAAKSKKVRNAAAAKVLRPPREPKRAEKPTPKAAVPASPPPKQLSAMTTRLSSPSPSRDRSKAHLFQVDKSLPPSPFVSVTDFKSTAGCKASAVVDIPLEQSSQQQAEEERNAEHLSFEDGGSLSVKVATSSQGNAEQENAAAAAAVQEAVSAAQQDMDADATKFSKETSLADMPSQTASAADADWKEMKPAEAPMPRKSPVPRAPSGFVMLGIPQSSMNTAMSPPKARVTRSQATADFSRSFNEKPSRSSRSGQLKSCRDLVLPPRETFRKRSASVDRDVNLNVKNSRQTKKCAVGGSPAIDADEVVDGHPMASTGRTLRSAMLVVGNHTEGDVKTRHGIAPLAKTSRRDRETHASSSSVPTHAPALAKNSRHVEVAENGRAKTARRSLRLNK